MLHITRGLKIIAFVLVGLRCIFLSVLYFTIESTPPCSVLYCCGKIWWCRPWHGTGWTGAGSGPKCCFRSILAYTVKSSTHFSFAFSILSFLLLGFVTVWPIVSMFDFGPTRPIMKQNIQKPNGQPWPPPPGISHSFDVFDLYFILNLPIELIKVFFNPL